VFIVVVVMAWERLGRRLGREVGADDGKRWWGPGIIGGFGAEGPGPGVLHYCVSY
jgi:hypothetical protein